MKNPERVAELIAELKAECEFRFEFEAVIALTQSVSELPRVNVIDDEHQEFRGKTFFRRKPSGHYYSYDSLTRGKVALHRVVWIAYFGEIPDGCVIHHVDFNPANNDISNLVCLTLAEHRQIHSAEKATAQCEYCGKTFLTRPDYPAKFCSKNCYNKAHAAQKSTFICVQCGKEFKSFQKTAKFCSESCGDKYRRASTVIRCCAICGKEFSARRSRPAKTCSNACEQELRRRNKSLGQDKSHANAKLTNEQVRYIRSVYKPRDPEFGQTALARKFGVNQATMGDIVRGKTYKNAGGETHGKFDSRIPDEVRDEIRSLYREGARGYGAPALAKKFGISASAVTRIISEKDGE